MCPSEELRASFEYSVKRQSRLRISFFLSFSFAFVWECRFESPFYYACIIRTCASILGRWPPDWIIYKQNLATPLSLDCIYVHIHMYWLWRKLRKERHALILIQINSARKFQAVRTKSKRATIEKILSSQAWWSRFQNLLLWFSLFYVKLGIRLSPTVMKPWPYHEPVWGQKQTQNTAQQPPLPPSPPRQHAHLPTLPSFHSSFFLIERPCLHVPAADSEEALHSQPWWVQSFVLRETPQTSLMHFGSSTIFFFSYPVPTSKHLTTPKTSLRHYYL